ncbi:MAG: biotin transporter BioY [Hyphomonas sp.]|uniref:biotin transporter BioY n=1 Tax=Hyphomonas sp. TaxID=87 RepID=UPI0017B93905|nr:biotin transporter BioY [Hyphomonas sp.]MBU3919849.1 biotin transporter BioY [Alphaproteobacteria bacterium]MBA3067090.1 biotin transporter BioY [Hyphomonas sp.]MBU4063114.1 biotin transporter BioY [Alphaproteobacteria bacterium]MBU4164431.1 biotin transporter BioY [Alphaproteobacteria bacterium]MBU4567597.1 biotin transporter BioY [Alphaproteobacteria bacterium]
MPKPIVRPSAHPLLRPALIGVCGLAALTVSSYVSLPMYPVPVTLQTLVVVLLGAVLGPRAGAATVLAWLGLALAGAPVLAGGTTGLIAFAGPTAGYLFAFPVAAFLAGLLPKGQAPALHAVRFTGFLGLHALILAMGGGWLAMLTTPEIALASGVAPFVAGSLLKSALATMVIVAMPDGKA